MSPLRMTTQSGSFYVGKYEYYFTQYFIKKVIMY